VGGALCSGSLLNNTANDGTQLFITASHCGSLNSAIFRFNYQKASCGSGSAPTNQTVQGSTQLQVDTSIDYRLVRITGSIPTSYNPYFAGWDRSGATPSSTTTVHHPSGGVKKISFDYNSPSKSGNDWRISQWDVGVTEPGSSGCPLYDNNGRFIGQLWGGAAYCGYPYNDYFGRLDRAWSRVSANLDPIGSGATSINGYDPGGGPPGGGSVQVSSISPSSVDALVPGSTQTLTINGSGFTPAVTVSVDGSPLVGLPSPYTYVSPTQITFDMPQMNRLGNVTVQVTVGTSSDTGTVTVTAPSSPKLQMGTGDEPVSLFSFVGADVTMSSQPADLFILLFSASPLSSINPGTVSLGIGNNFTSLFIGGFYSVSGSTAWTKVNIPFSGIAPGSEFYFQGIALPSGSVTLPVPASNRQHVKVLF